MLENRCAVDPEYQVPVAIGPEGIEQYVKQYKIPQQQEAGKKSIFGVGLFRSKTLAVDAVREEVVLYKMGNHLAVYTFNIDNQNHIRSAFCYDPFCAQSSSMFGGVDVVKKYGIPMTDVTLAQLDPSNPSKRPPVVPQGDILRGIDLAKNEIHRHQSTAGLGFSSRTVVLR